MLSLNGISAWIEVDGKELEQYGVEEDLDHNYVTCWIPTQADKTFSVVFRDNVAHREHCLASTLQFDGSPVAGKVLRSTSDAHFFNLITNRTVVQSDQTLSAISSRPFMFSKLELTDEDEYLGQTSAQLGEISIRITRVQVLESFLHRGSHASGHAKVHERSKKAVTHCVSYGQEVNIPPQYSCRTRNLDGDIPLATFIFKYRDLGLLQANGIIPKPPHKKAAVSGEILDLTLSSDVKEELAYGNGPSQKRTAVLMKRSKSNHENEVKPAKRIKRENNFVPTGEVIDLT